MDDPEFLVPIEREVGLRCNVKPTRERSYEGGDHGEGSNNPCILFDCSDQSLAERIGLRRSKRRLQHVQSKEQHVTRVTANF